MINLLVVVNVFYPDRGGGAAVFSDMCYALAKNDIDVTVQCAFPYYPEWRDKSGKNGFKILRYMDNGINVERYGLYIPNNPGSLWERILYEISFFLSLSRALFVNSKKFDVVMVYYPLAGAVTYAILRKVFFNTPVWINIQDLSAEAAEAAEITNICFINRLFKKIQNFLFNHANLLTSISPIMVDRLKKIQKHNKKIEYLPNWVNCSLSECIKNLKDKNKKNFVISNPLKLLYAGNIGNKQDLLRLCHLFLESKVNFSFNIYGNGSKAREISKFVNTIRDKRFKFGPFLEELEFAQELYNADFYVITERTNIGASFIPSKLIPGIMSETPILAVCDDKSPLGQEMQKAKIGPFFTWSQIEKIPEFLESIYKCKYKYLNWVENAKSRAGFYDRERILRQIQEYLVNLALNSPRDN